MIVGFSTQSEILIIPPNFQNLILKTCNKLMKLFYEVINAYKKTLVKKCRYEHSNYYIIETISRTKKMQERLI